MPGSKRPPIKQAKKKRKEIQLESAGLNTNKLFYLPPEAQFSIKICGNA